MKNGFNDDLPREVEIRAREDGNTSGNFFAAIERDGVAGWFSYLSLQFVAVDILNIGTSARDKS